MLHVTDNGPKLSPEGFASILWKDSKRASEAAKVMKMTAKDLYELGLIERIIAEDLPATAETAEIVGEIIDPPYERVL